LPTKAECKLSLADFRPHEGIGLSKRVGVGACSIAKMRCPLPRPLCFLASGAWPRRQA